MILRLQRKGSYFLTEASKSMAKKAFGATFEAGNQKPHRLVFVKKTFVGPPEADTTNFL
jgi:hypothetical protein